MTSSAEHGEIIRREKRGLLGNALASCVGQGGVIVFGLGAMVVNTRLLGAEGYGRLTVFFMALGVLTKLALGWPNLAVARFGREDMKSGRGIGPVFWARVWVYVVCCVATASLVYLHSDQVNAYLGLGPSGAWILTGYAALLAGVELLAAVFQALGRFRVMAALSATVKLFNFLLLLGFFVFVAQRADAEVVLRLHLISVGAVLFFAAAVAARSGVGPPALGSAAFRRMSGYAWPVVFAGIASVTVEWIDTIVLKAVRPIGEVGVYGAAYQSVNVLGGLRAAVIAVLWPFIVSLVVENRHEALRWCLDELMPALAVLAGVAFAAAAVGAELIPLIFGGDFAPGVLPCQILVAAVAFTCVHALASNMANACDRVKSVVAVSLVMAGANLVGDLWLVPRIGPVGAAISTCAAFAIAAVLALRLVNGIGALRGDRPGRRYLALAGFAPVLAIPLAGVLAGSLGRRLAAYAVVIAVWTVGVRLSGRFRRSAFDRLDEIDLPKPVAAILCGTAWALSRREVET